MDRSRTSDELRSGRIGRTDRLVIFGLDGTLFRTESVTVPAVQESFESIGLPVPNPDVILSFIGQLGSAMAQWAGQLHPDRDVDRLMAEIDKHELELVRTVGRLFDGVADGLVDLKSEFGALAICSNGGAAYVNEVLDARKIRQHFNLVRYRREDDVSKSGMVKDVVNHFEATLAVVVGDRQDDVRAAKENGLGSVGAGYGFGKKGELDGADAIAESFGRVPDLVRSVFDIIGRD
ncbi:MAG: HAD family hydrolase [SAR202 cluster bacterium]|nr:HAD family hydrolase [SAR202 cluster bacterium]